MEKLINVLRPERPGSASKAGAAAASEEPLPQQNDATITGFAYLEKGGKLTPYEYSPPPLGISDIEVQVTHCGVCHSDLWMRDNFWGHTKYPLIPGHVGEEAARGLKVGDRVGFGWLRDSCGACKSCIAGEEQVCEQPGGPAGLITGGNLGGFQSHLRAPARLAFKIPPSMKSEEAAPLLCAGVTVFQPLQRYARAGGEVGIVSLGGLGHLAVQFARAMGCRVTVLSTSDRKAEDARRQLILEQYGGAAPFDFLLDTTPAEGNWAGLLRLLRPFGTLCIVGNAAPELKVGLGDLSLRQRSVVGSVIGGRRAMRDMLEFAAMHGVRPQVEVLPFGQAARAVEKLEERGARYRTVLAFPARIPAGSPAEPAAD